MKLSYPESELLENKNEIKRQLTITIGSIINFGDKLVNTILE